MDIKIFIKDTGVAAIRKGHPWVFEGAVAKIDGAPMSGDLVRILDRQSDFLGWAWYSVESRVKARIIATRGGEDVGPDWLAASLASAAARRAHLVAGEEQNAYRLVNAEADGLPGLIIDIYHRFAVIQALSAGAESRKAEVAAWLMDNLGLSGVYERSEGEARRLEGLNPAKGVLLGAEPGPVEEVVIAGCPQRVDLISGEGTGAYLDQRPARRLLAPLTKGQKVLDLCCHSGGFAISALRAGAESAVLVDTSARALKEARVNLRYNDLRLSPKRGADLVQGNAASVLRQFREAGRRFGAVVLDPPPLAPARAKAAKAAKEHGDLHFQALKLLEPGGVLAAFSRTPGLEAAEVEESLTQAARDLRLGIQITAHIGPSDDFPALPGFSDAGPPSGIICRVL